MKALKIQPREYVSGIMIMAALMTGSCQRNSQEPEELSSLPETVLEEALQTYQDSVAGILGVMVHIDYEGYEPWSSAVGSFDSSHVRALEPDDQFWIGSITKTFTATLVLQLWEEGLVNLDRPIIRYLPVEEAAVLDSIRYGEQITVRQALMHRSGLFSYTRSLALLEEIYQDPSMHQTAVEVLRIVRDEGAPDFIPGERFRYSNTNYLLLGLVVEGVTEMTYEEALQERICDKLNLDRTFMPAGSLLDEYENLAHGYEDAIYGFGGGDVDGQEFNPASRSAWAAGGIVSTAAELALFFRALAEGKLYRKKDTYQLMTDPGQNSWYGMGIFVMQQESLGQTFYGHGGGTIGYDSFAYYFPAYDLVMSSCITLDGSVEFIVPQEVLDYLIVRLPGI